MFILILKTIAVIAKKTIDDFIASRVYPCTEYDKAKAKNI
jgi:hypothetical protein